MDFQKTNANLLKYIKNATSPFHVVLESQRMLEEAGFISLDLTKKWSLEKTGKYYINAYGTTLFAFTVGEELGESIRFRIAAAHTDHPCFKVKPSAEMVDNQYLKLNTDVYGGPIVNTWLDRPLSLAGKVAIRSKDLFRPDIRYIDLKQPLLTIPNLAIHMNRDVNKGVELNRQSDTIPVIGLMNDALNKDQFFVNYLANHLGVEASDILDFDLYVYNLEEGCMLGMEEEIISSPRLDNLTSCYALTEAIMKGTGKKDINFIALFDNEEIGSRTKQGADSSLLNFVMEKICAGLSYSHMDYCDAVLNSMLCSVDVAHAIHPNRSEKSDPTNKVKLNEGFVIKLNSNQKYATDSEAIAIVQQICDSEGIAYQKYVNRSDIAGGGTLGSITSSWLPMKTVDMGIPMLAMHSAREMMGSKDQAYLESFVTAFFSK